MNNKMGLVLSGGGGKGAYEIGVWKYLVEAGLDKDIKYVSGTSVGALNAALFVGSTYERAEAVWENITKEQILEPRANAANKEEFINEVSISMAKSGFSPKDLIQKLGLGFKSNAKDIGKAVVARNIVKIMVLDKMAMLAVPGILEIPVVIAFERIAKMYYDKYIEPYLMENILFTQDSLKRIIEENIDFNRLKESDVKCYATCFNISRMHTKSYLLNARPQANEKEFITILAASSAIPIVFEPVIFENEKFCDGGIPKLGNNTPIKPIIGNDVDYIIVVYLGNDKKTNLKKYPNQRIIDIVPSKDLGGKIDGTLNFDHDKIMQLMELGYNDAKNTLGPIIAFGR